MVKRLLTYSFNIFLLLAIVSPTLYSSFENDFEVENFEPIEDENSEENSFEDFQEIKIYYSADIAFFYNHLLKRKQYSFYSKKYKAKYKNLDTPPPELIA